MSQAPEVTHLSIAMISRDGGTQPREAVNTAVAKEYAEAMALGAKFPAPVTFYDGKNYWLGGGFHRVLAAELTGATAIDVEVRQGTQREAILFSLSENVAHGLPRTNADKRRVIARMLDDEEWRKWSDREIARRLQVDGKTVAAMRPKEAAEIRSERTFVNRHGTTSTMDVTNIRIRVAPDAPTPIDADPSTRPLRVFLGEIRAGADVRSAAVVAEISFASAQGHAVAEARGEYDNVVEVTPSWKIEGPTMIFDVPSSAAVFADTANAANAANDRNEQPAPKSRVFDLATAEIREGVMKAIATLARAPSPRDLADIWSGFLGHGIPAETVEIAADWLIEFAAKFPEAEARRQESVAAMMEKL